MTTTKVNAPIRRALAAWALVLGSGLSGCVVAPYPHHDGQEDRGVVVEPPPVRIERSGPPPAVGYFWIDGYWNWSRGRHVWMPGHWAPRRDGHRWEPHRWERGRRGWESRGGQWHRY
ncbi:MAG: YXWGXW repeat-containing protein [Sphaerotilus sp.]|nr:YXWGXW repeat-containing protein [Sphaerotilus sp.]